MNVPSTADKRFRVKFEESCFSPLDIGSWNEVPAERRDFKVDFSPDQEAVYKAMRSWVRRPSSRLLTCGGYAGTGKGQPLDAQILTPFGFTRMGDLKVGSLVCNPDGTVAKVIAVHELGERDVYRFTTSDGGSTLATDDHLWLVKRASKPHKADRQDMDGNVMWGRIETTAQLYEYAKTQEGRTRTYLPQVPLTKPVLLTAANRGSRPIDPYVLGVILGDGGITQEAVILTSADQFIVDELERILSGKLTPVNGMPYGYRVPVGLGVRDGLVELGLMGKLSYEKSVPLRYKMGTIEQRFGVVQGLMDTDGTAARQGAASYTTTSEQLATDMQWMLRSLGYRATRTTRIPTYTGKDGEKLKGRLAYTLHIQGRDTKLLFRLPRKKDRCPKFFNGGYSEVARRIDSIVPEGRAVCRCITVDHPNGLYIADDFIVTHNSTLVTVLANEMREQRVAFCALTGKATGVLRRKMRECGINSPNHDVLTLHSLLYQCFIHDCDSHPPLPPQDDGRPTPCPDKGRLRWSNKAQLEAIPYDLIVVDEASMVTRQILDDLVGLGAPILAVGDHGQLPPVGGDGSLMQDPMLRLETIHRQARGNPILELSAYIRENGRLPPASHFKGDGRVQFHSQLNFRKVAMDLYLKEGIKATDIATLVWMNKTRTRLNDDLRHIHHRRRDLPEAPIANDQVICLRNAYRTAFNGMRGFVTEVKETPSEHFYDGAAEFPDENLAFHGSMNAHTFGMQKPIADLDVFEKKGLRVRKWDDLGFMLDYGYALTTHKAQGSQFHTVMVVVETPSQTTADIARRHLYTSVTRASERLVLFT